MRQGLEEAIKRTDTCPYRRTFHSDRGWGYQMTAYQAMLEEHHIFQSMSRKGTTHPWKTSLASWKEKSMTAMSTEAGENSSGPSSALFATTTTIESKKS